MNSGGFNYFSLIVTHQFVLEQDFPSSECGISMRSSKAIILIRADMINAIIKKYKNKEKYQIYVKTLARN